MGAVKGESASMAPKANCVLRSCPQLEIGFSSIQRKRNQSWNLFFFRILPKLRSWCVSFPPSLTFKSNEQHQGPREKSLSLFSTVWCTWGSHGEVQGGVWSLWKPSGLVSIYPSSQLGESASWYLFLTYKWKVYLFTLNYKGACEAKI